MRLGERHRFNGRACKNPHADGSGTCGARFSVFGTLVVQAAGPYSIESGLFRLSYFWQDAAGKLYKEDAGRLIYTCPGCGRGRYAYAVLGKVVAGKKCDGRCLAATGFQCECACGGRNHGAGHEVHA